VWDLDNRERSIKQPGKGVGEGVDGLGKASHRYLLWVAYERLHQPSGETYIPGVEKVGNPRVPLRFSPERIKWGVV